LNQSLIPVKPGAGPIFSYVAVRAGSEHVNT
jgi:hypothetical protein